PAARSPNTEHMFYPILIVLPKFHWVEHMFSIRAAGSRIPCLRKRIPKGMEKGGWPMIVLGIDPGTAITGYGVVDFKP
ncbi:MAG TPA: hypothetical protein DDZ65_06580, partial [Firmicutes bacterium]|nr:hypothetical protein [Bacillota bacterium]